LYAWLIERHAIVSIISELPQPVRVIDNTWIPLADGCRLAARLWLPETAERHPVPAILEYLPYRKRDGTAVRDALTHPYLAGHGYACVRVDMRGNGDSDGLMWDEYLPQEQDDALEVIAWLATQPWCSGRVGMIGISWGGFNALQVAARQPPALGAVISLCATADRYADDIHYKGGCLLTENLGWSSTMLSYSSRPPDPDLVGTRWREIWLERLAQLPHLAETWLAHQSRDDYWRHGSLCEDYAAVRVPVLAVGGWGDAYRNTVATLLENLPQVCCKGIMGPWVHKYPHFAVPEPRIGFLKECLRWWDRWLKGIPTGVEDDPDYRVYLQDGGPPQTMFQHRPGRWVSEPRWPSPHIEFRPWYLGSAVLSEQAGAELEIRHRAPEDTGETAGEYCAIWLGPELPGDQRVDDGRSLFFDGPVLSEVLEILGAPLAVLRIAVDRPQAHVAVRLNAVNPDGSVERLSYAVLNLSQRTNREHPRPMTPGEAESITFTLDHCGCRLQPGQRLRLALSTAYWPLIWPDPEPVTLTLLTAGSTLSLPVRRQDNQPLPVFPAVATAPPLKSRELRPVSHERRFSRSLVSGYSEAEFMDDFGEQENLEHGLITGSVAREHYRILPQDPSSARMQTQWTQTLRRGDWSVRTECRAALACDTTAFYLSARMEAYENEKKVHEKNWTTSIPRRHL
jgi:putative CocE/NonD family hydrolase